MTGVFSSEASRKDYTVLVADDDDLGRHAIARLIEREGYTCLEARTAQEALAAVEASRIHLCLCDIRMPGNMDLELLKELQNRKPRIPVILMTGFPTVQTAVTATSLSVSAYLLKPLDFQELIKVVRKEFDLFCTLRSLEASRLRQEKVLAEMQDLAAALQQPNPAATSGTTISYASLAFENALQTLLELRAVIRSLLEQNQDELQKNINLSRPTALIGAIQDAIYVIDQTKHSFKSKELAALKQRLDSVLRDEGRPQKT